MAADPVGFRRPGHPGPGRGGVDAAERALAGTLGGGVLEPLRQLLDRRRTPAHDLIETFRRTGAIPPPTRRTARAAALLG